MRWPAPDLSDAVQCDALQERFAGTVVRVAAGRGGAAADFDPAVGLAETLLQPDSGFVAGLERAYGDLTEHRQALLVLQTAAVSAAFLLDSAYRHDALETLCRGRLPEHGLLVVHPPSLIWRARDQQTSFRLPRPRDRDLALCTLLGELGFAQLCDSRLREPIPLLVQPWCAGRGLVRPSRLPGKAFSQRLCVDRVGERRLLLFDRHAQSC